MAGGKRNTWLDPELSDEDAASDFSDALEESRGKTFARRENKRQRTASNIESDSDDGFDSESALQQEGGTGLFSDNAKEDNTERDGNSTEHADKRDSDVLSAPDTTERKRLSRPTQSHSNKTSKTGVIYISRVPPFMKPQTIRNLLSQFGEVGRIFLTPEDPAAYSRRVKAGGNKKRSFSDGWVEFLDKKDAKMVAETLNAQIIGGKKGSWYHDDLWNIKYLKGFKWQHLTEQIANENAERATRLRSEIAHTTRENMQFLEQVEKAKMLKGMEAKQASRANAGTTSLSGSSITSTVISSSTNGEKHMRHFRQNEARTNHSRYKEQAGESEDVKRVLKKLF